MSSMVIGSGGGHGGPNGGSNTGGGGRGVERGGGLCVACKFLRRKCVNDCIFAPFFSSEEGMENFVVVHKVFGASNTSKLLHQVPLDKRRDAALTICYEAKERISNPVYGCASYIMALQEQVWNLQTELANMQTLLATMQIPSPPSFDPQLLIPMMGEDTVNLSSYIVDPEVQSQWAFQQQQAPNQGGGNDFTDGSDVRAGNGTQQGQVGSPQPHPPGTYQ